MDIKNLLLAFLLIAMLIAFIEITFISVRRSMQSHWRKTIELNRSEWIGIISGGIAVLLGFTILGLAL